MAKLTTLGELALHPGPFTQPKPLVMLAYLALEGRKPRRHLAELLWPDGNGLKSLSMAITRLRKVGGAVCGADARLVWADLDSDVTGLIAALGAGDLDLATAHWGGAFLEGVECQGASAELGEWILETRERLAKGYRDLLLRRAEEELAAGRLENAAGHAAAAYRLPGAAPAGHETLQRLHRLFALTHHELAGAVAAELGELGPEPGEEPGSPLGRQAHVLFATPFLGREEELGAVASALADARTRVLTLLGPGGAGKSRLALQAALEAERRGPFAGAVSLALLDDIDRPELLPARVAQALGMQGPLRGDPWEQLAGAIGDRRLLLVLDNMEQLAAAGPDLGRLVAAAPGLTLLLTSRVLLGVQGERTLRVGGLGTPDVGTAWTDTAWTEALRYPAVRLLNDLALAAQANLDLRSQAAGVLRVCQELGGLPLGLELAAPWLRMMPAAALAERIATSPRGLSAEAGRGPADLRSVIEVTWAALDGEEQDALARLAVFIGGFDHAAAEAVAGVELGTLAALLDKSWLRTPAPGRLDRHQHVYAFTHEQLERQEGVLAELSERHARWFLALAKRSDPRLRGPDQLEHLRLLDAERANLGRALAYFEEADPAGGLELAASLGAFWLLHGHDSEGLTRLLGFIQQSGADVTPTLVKARVRAAQLAERLGRDELARSLYESALEGAAAIDEPGLLAEARLGYAVCVRQNRGDYAGAMRHMEAALATARSEGFALLASDALRLMGDLVANQGDYQGAVACFEEAAALASEGGDELSEAKARLSLSSVLVYMRDDGRARWLAERSLETFRKLGDRLGEASALANLGTLIDERGDARECKRLYRQSLAILRRLGDPRATAALLNNLASVCNTLGEYDEARGHLEESLNWLRRANDAALTTHALYLYGLVLLRIGDMEACRRRLDECISLCRRHGEAWSLMRALHVLARWHRASGEPGAALACAIEAEELAVAAGDGRTSARAKALIGELHAELAACGAAVAAAG